MPQRQVIDLTADEPGPNDVVSGNRLLYLQHQQQHAASSFASVQDLLNSNAAAAAAAADEAKRRCCCAKLSVEYDEDF